MTRNVRLGDVVEFTNGGTPSRSKAEFWSGSVPWITGADITDEGRVTARSFVSEKAISTSSTNVLPRGTVLLLTRTSVGKVGLLREATAINQDITGITPSSAVDTNYLLHFLRASKPKLLKNARGATIKGVTRDDVASLELALPSMVEQRRIAAILDQADALCAKRRETVSRLDDLTRSIFLTMFGDSAGPIRTVEEIAEMRKGSIRTGPFGSQLLHSEFVDDGVAVLGIDNVVTNEFRWAGRRFITPEKYETLKRYTVTPGDVLITIMGTCGRCAIVPEDAPTAINTKHICAITVDRSKVLPEFLRACFLWHPASRRHLSRSAKGAIMDGLNMGIVKVMPMPVPPLGVQREFVTRTGTVDQRRTDAMASQERIDELVASLRTDAFGGDL